MRRRMRRARADEFRLTADSASMTYRIRRGGDGGEAGRCCDHLTIFAIA
jgi:hypothetical protein